MAFSCEGNGISRWSAPKNVLVFPLNVSFIEKIRITYAQGEDEDGKPLILFEKTEADCEFRENQVLYDLSQEETLMLDTKELVAIQVQGYDNRGVPFVGDVVYSTVDDVLNEGVSW